VNVKERTLFFDWLVDTAFGLEATSEGTVLLRNIESAS